MKYNQQTIATVNGVNEASEDGGCDTKRFVVCHMQFI